MKRLIHLALAAAAAWAGHASAHDTWLERRAASTPERPQWVLGTGNLYPVFDSLNSFDSIQSGGCRAGGAGAVALQRADPTEEALVVAPVRDLPRAPRVTCWAQLQPFDVELPDELVEAYFKESMPPQSVRQAWAELKARGVGWSERYVKHARAEWFPDPAAEDAQPALPVGMGVDALMLQPRRAPRVGDEAEFELLKDGQPLRNLSVEFRLHSSRFGLWRRTDENGRVRLRLPSAGRWLLRAIELTPPPQASQRWQGLFITLAFDVSVPARP